jgi:hypothetical protein
VATRGRDPPGPPHPSTSTPLKLSAPPSCCPTGPEVTQGLLPVQGMRRSIPRPGGQGPPSSVWTQEAQRDPGVGGAPKSRSDGHCHQLLWSGCQGCRDLAPDLAPTGPPWHHPGNGAQMPHSNFQQRPRNHTALLPSGSDCPQAGTSSAGTHWADPGLHTVGSE